MTAYYNENDRFCAAWLRELIKRNLIADGEVDEQSIEDVRPKDLQGFTQCHFFAGIGVWSYALRQAGFPDDRPCWTGSCPCQPFSTAGKGKGFLDERHLWPSWFHLISVCKPVTIFGEQVAGKNGKTWLALVQNDMEGIGYRVGACVTAACGFGAPHIRKRMYFVADSQGMANPKESDGRLSVCFGRPQQGRSELDWRSETYELENPAIKGLEGTGGKSIQKCFGRPAETGFVGVAHEAGLQGQSEFAESSSSERASGSPSFTNSPEGMGNSELSGPSSEQQFSRTQGQGGGVRI